MAREKHSGDEPPESESIGDFGSAQSFGPRADINHDGHGHFRGLCIAYGDYYRPTFLREFAERFIKSASKAELAGVRTLVALRARTLSQGTKGRASDQSPGKKGRPAARSDNAWLANAKILAFRRNCGAPDLATDRGIRRAEPQ
jgi:hypothetical protein